MPRALVLLPESIAGLDLAGRPLRDHWAWVCAEAGLVARMVRPDSLPADAGAAVVVDGRFPAVAPASLAALRIAGEGLLLAPHGEVLAAAFHALALDGPLNEQLDAVPGRATAVASAEEGLDLDQVGRATAVVRARKVAALAAAGVRFVDAARVVVDTRVEVGPGSMVWPDVVLRGTTTLGASVEVQAGAWLVDTTVADRAVIRPYCVCEGAEIGRGASVGPFAHLRAGAVLEGDTRVGNFVEVKKATLRRGAKASHLAYLGDAEIGARSNIGAGTITCNYDGFAKHRTEIGPDVFVGSNTSLVAPVTVGSGAIIGAGSVVTRDVPDNALYVERATPRVLEGKAPRVRARNKARAEAGDE